MLTFPIWVFKSLFIFKNNKKVEVITDLTFYSIIVGIKKDEHRNNVNKLMVEESYNKWNFAFPEKRHKEDLCFQNNELFRG